MDGAVGVRVAGPLAPYASGFGAELARVGYTRLSVRGQLGLVAHLSRWLAGEGLDAAALCEATVDAFLAARRAAGYTGLLTPKALRPLLERYRSYLTGERGLGAETARGSMWTGSARSWPVGQRPAGSIWST